MNAPRHCHSLIAKARCHLISLLAQTASPRGEAYGRGKKQNHCRKANGRSKGRTPQSRPIYAKIPGEKSRFYLTARMRCGNMITPLLRGLFFVPTSRARPATPREAK